MSHPMIPTYHIQKDCLLLSRKHTSCLELLLTREGPPPPNQKELQVARHWYSGTFNHSSRGAEAGRSL